METNAAPTRVWRPRGWAKGCVIAPAEQYYRGGHGSVIARPSPREQAGVRVQPRNPIELKTRPAAVVATTTLCIELLSHRKKPRRNQSIA